MRRRPPERVARGAAPGPRPPRKRHGRPTRAAGWPAHLEAWTPLPSQGRPNTHSRPAMHCIPGPEGLETPPAARRMRPAAGAACTPGPQGRPLETEPSGHRSISSKSTPWQPSGGGFHCAALAGGHRRPAQHSSAGLRWHPLSRETPRLREQGPQAPRAGAPRARHSLRTLDSGPYILAVSLRLGVTGAPSSCRTPPLLRVRRDKHNNAWGEQCPSSGPAAPRRAARRGECEGGAAFFACRHFPSTALCLLGPRRPHRGGASSVPNTWALLEHKAPKAPWKSCHGRAHRPSCQGGHAAAAAGPPR